MEVGGCLQEFLLLLRQARRGGKQPAGKWGQRQRRSTQAKHAATTCAVQGWEGDRGGEGVRGAGHTFPPLAVGCSQLSPVMALRVLKPLRVWAVLEWVGRLPVDRDCTQWGPPPGLV